MHGLQIINANETYIYIFSLYVSEFQFQIKKKIS